MTLAQGIALLDVSRKVLSGELTDPVQLSRALVGLALDLAPVEELAPYLTEEARRRADAAVDILEAVAVSGG